VRELAVQVEIAVSEVDDETDRTKSDRAFRLFSSINKSSFLSRTTSTREEGGGGFKFDFDTDFDVVGGAGGLGRDILDGGGGFKFDANPNEEGGVGAGGGLATREEVCFAALTFSSSPLSSSAASPLGSRLAFDPFEENEFTKSNTTPRLFAAMN